MFVKTIFFWKMKMKTFTFVIVDYAKVALPFLVFGSVQDRPSSTLAFFDLFKAVNHRIAVNI